jgi:phosphoribosylamine-glycine ligase
LIDLSNKTVIVYDSSAGFTHMAEALVGDFGRVLYYSVWDKAFPAVRDYIPGTGLDGIERVYDFFDAIDGVDLVVFPDVGNSGLQEWLRKQGMPVFGSGAGAQLERDRWYLKSVCKRFGIDAADAIPVTGLDNLRNVLGEMDDVFVKMSIFRGDDETFRHLDQVDTTRRLNELMLKMEPYHQRAEFVVEQPITGKCVEVGADLPVNVAGVYPRDNLWGYEVKDEAYAGRVGPLPERIQTVVDRLSPILQYFDYRGAMCTETRETRDGSYFLDFTARFGNPPSALQRFMIANWGELMWEAAHGRVVEPEWNAPVGVEIILHSEYGSENPLRVTVGRWDRTVLYGHAAYDGSDYAVSPAQIPECGGACGMGSTLTQALEEAYEVAEAVKGRDLTWDAGALEQLTETIKTGTELGINWE